MTSSQDYISHNYNETRDTVWQGLEPSKLGSAHAGPAQTRARHHNPLPETGANTHPVTWVEDFNLMGHAAVIMGDIIE